jgi:hypothetical protein
MLPSGGDAANRERRHPGVWQQSVVVFRAAHSERFLWLRCGGWLKDSRPTDRQSVFCLVRFCEEDTPTWCRPPCASDLASPVVGPTLRGMTLAAVTQGWVSPQRGPNNNHSLFWQLPPEAAAATALSAVFFLRRSNYFAPAVQLLLMTFSWARFNSRVHFVV